MLYRQQNNRCLDMKNIEKISMPNILIWKTRTRLVGWNLPDDYQTISRFDCIKNRKILIDERLRRACSREGVEDEFNYFVCEYQTHSILRENLFRKVNVTQAFQYGTRKKES